jgi:hypothetical protein
MMRDHAGAVVVEKRQRRDVSTSADCVIEKRGGWLVTARWW